MMRCHLALTLLACAFTHTWAQDAPPVRCAATNDSLHVATLSPDMAFAWRVDGRQLIVTADFGGLPPPGWVAVAFGETPSMVPAIGWVGSVQGGGVREVLITARSEQGVQPKADQSMLVGGTVEVDAANQRTLLHFTRNMDQDVNDLPPTHLLWAAGTGPVPNNHLGRRGGATLNLRQCSGDADTNDATTTTTSGPPPTQIPGPNRDLCPASDPEVDFERQVDQRVSFGWKVEGGQVTLRARIQGDVTGWFGLGFATEANSMAPATAYVGTGNGLQQYALTSESDAGVAPENGASNGSLAGGPNGTILTVRLPQSALPATLNLNGSTHVIWAMGPTNQMGFHGTNRGSGTVDMAACRLVAPSQPTKAPIPGPTPAPAPAPSTGTPGASAGSKGTCSGVDGYERSVAVDNSMRFDWSVREDVLSGRATFGKEAGWLAFGLSDRPSSMAGSIAFIGQTADQSTLQEYVLGATDPHSGSQANNPPLTGRYHVTNGQSMLEFNRTITPDVAARINATAPLHVVYAFGSSPTFGPHGSNRFAVTVDQSACSATSTLADRTKQITAHGALMATAWLLTAPLAILTARFGKPLSTGTSVPLFWFHAHWILQVCTLVLATAGLIVATQMTTSFEPEPHQVIGVLVMALLYVQPVISIVRPRPLEPNGTKSTLRLAWEYAHKGNGWVVALLALANVGVGLHVASAANPLPPLYYTWVAVLVLLGAALTMWVRYKRRAQNVPVGDSHVAAPPTARQKGEATPTVG